MTVVLDASAVLAALLGENGAEAVEARLNDAIISAVNVAEVAAALVRQGNSPVQARALMTAWGLRVIAADEELALDAGFLRAVTDFAGLSLGDRFCLALARRFNAPALTGDRAWMAVAAPAKVDIQLIR